MVTATKAVTNEKYPAMLPLNPSRIRIVKNIVQMGSLGIFRSVKSVANTIEANQNVTAILTLKKNDLYVGSVINTEISGSSLRVSVDVLRSKTLVEYPLSDHRVLQKKSKKVSKTMTDRAVTAKVTAHSSEIVNML